MQNSQKNKLWIEWCAGKLCLFLYKCKIPFFSAFGVGLLTYMFTLTNKLVNFDDVYCLFSRGGTLESGRWGLYLIWRFLPNLSMPWLHGVTTLLLLSLSACVIIHTLEIRTPVLQGFTSALFISFPSMIGIVCYMFDASAYALSVFFASLSLYLGLRAADGLFSKERLLRQSLVHLLFSVGFCALSLSIYQSFFMLIASLFLAVLLDKLLIKHESAGKVLRKGLLLLGILILSFISYYLVLRFFWWRHHTSGGSYMSSMTDTGSLSFLDLLQRTYQFLPDVVQHGTYGLVATKLSKLAHVVLFCFLLFQLVLLSIRAKSPFSIVLAILLVLLFPVSVGAIILLSGDNVHSLMFFSFTSYYFLAGLLLDESFSQSGMAQRLACNILSLVFLALTANSIFVGNSAFLKLHLAYENSYSFYGSIVNQVKTLPELNPHSKLAIVGKSEMFVNDFSQFPASDGIMGATGFEVNDYSYTRFIKYYIGFNIEFADEEELNLITSSEAFAEMPHYPFAGSIHAFDDIIVVKLSDPASLPSSSQ